MQATQAAFAASSLYISVESGYVKQEGFPSADLVHASNVDEKFPPTYRTAIGYNHDIFCCLGVGGEIAAGYFNEFKYLLEDNANISTHAKTLEFLALTQLHLGCFDLIAKGGGMRYTNVIENQANIWNETKIRPEWGMAAAFNITRHLAVTLSYLHLFGGGYLGVRKNFYFECSNTTRDEVLLGLRYAFCG